MYICKYMCIYIYISQGFTPAAGPCPGCWLLDADWLAGWLAAGWQLAGWLLQGTPRILGSLGVGGNTPVPRPHSSMPDGGSRIQDTTCSMQDAGIEGCECKDT